RPPAELAPDFGDVHGVAAIVAEAVGYVADELRIAAPSARAQPVEQRADRAHDVDVRPLVLAADVVRLADLAFLEHEAQRLAVVGDIEPVAHVAPVAEIGRASCRERG